MQKLSISNLICSWLSACKLRTEMRRRKKEFTIHEQRDGYDVKLTLIHIIKKGDVPLDEASAVLAKKMFLFTTKPSKWSPWSSQDKIRFNEKVSEMTMEDIRHDQQCWNDHCEAAWQGYQ